MGNGRQNHKFSSPCIELVLMEIHAGGNQRGGEKQQIDLEWPYIKVYGNTIQKCTLIYHRYPQLKGREP